MIKRLKQSTVIDTIIICTSTNKEDAPLIDIANDEKINYYLGAEEDVLMRLYEASNAFKLDYILNVTADCPLVSIEYLPIIVNEYKRTKADLIRTLDLPHGFFSYGINPDALGKICKNKTGINTEVWGKYFTEDNSYKFFDVPIPKYFVRKDYRLTLDYPEDFDFFKKIYDYFGNETYKVGITDIIYFLDEHPEIVDINKHCKELYKKKFETQNKRNI